MLRRQVAAPPWSGSIYPQRNLPPRSPASPEEMITAGLKIELAAADRITSRMASPSRRRTGNRHR